MWAAIPQLLALPLVWRLMHRLDTRVVGALGLLLCAVGTALVIDGTALFAAEQFRLTLVLFSVGQLLFLASAMVVGATSLRPVDLPTASLAFNVTTLGGTTRRPRVPFRHRAREVPLQRHHRDRVAVQRARR
jgi:MFS transporter, DHA2 family, multidrug resistance protein